MVKQTDHYQQDHNQRRPSFLHGVTSLHSSFSVLPGDTPPDLHWYTGYTPYVIVIQKAFLSNKCRSTPEVISVRDAILTHGKPWQHGHDDHCWGWIGSSGVDNCQLLSWINEVTRVHCPSSSSAIACTISATLSTTRTKCLVNGLAILQLLSVSCSCDNTTNWAVLNCPNLNRHCPSVPSHRQTSLTSHGTIRLVLLQSCGAFSSNHSGAKLRRRPCGSASVTLPQFACPRPVSKHLVQTAERRAWGCCHLVATRVGARGGAAPSWCSRTRFIVCHAVETSRDQTSLETNLKSDLILDLKTGFQFREV